MRKAIVLILLALIASTTALTGENAVLLECRGRVQIISSGKSAPAMTGQNLETGDIISTGSDGTALILLADGAAIELLPDSRLQLENSRSDRDGKKSSLLGELWKSIKSKFADAEYSSAQTGGVGALRGSDKKEEILNDYLTRNLLEEMEDKLKDLDDQDLTPYTLLMMKALIYEIYGQYGDAESNYLSMIEIDPTEPLSYNLLVDLYMKIDCYNHAIEMVRSRNEIPGE
ncbi:hypothetical protein [Spirochaeta isovalerica]|uniref:Tetratricopeptide (TPR) repeat protein n=1 Tax=Spirochaeta isovalerica TaxID=150 RepID=A0A841RAH0_9SPIO|nr:hypothetical protein [Spirochaeta isovalerica]MBB6480010.1 tetratricopeptide (TPR) repeat protein [Spirochaeta isovalerica]